tara:strand:- start:156 stop:401 length:246 start_codon:yes stop_codon:yes gene_type:complete
MRRAAKAGGMRTFKREGKNTIMASVMVEITAAWRFREENIVGQARTEETGVPDTVSRPKKGMICINIMMAPIPDINPETTE